MSLYLWFAWICIALIGVVVGSFLNVCIYRIPKKLSIVSGNKGRSMCTDCSHTLRWYDLVPLVSYLLLKGKCRYCHEPISPRYPVVELLNGSLWLLAVVKFGFIWPTVLYCIFFSVLIVISWIDWDTQEIPYRLTAIILGLGIASFFLDNSLSWQDRLIGLFIISLPMVILTLLVGGFGGGDIQLMAVTGLFLGWRVNVIAMFVAVLLAGLISILILRKRGRKTKIPFGPYLAVGLVVGVFFADSLVNWYLSFF